MIFTVLKSVSVLMGICHCIGCIWFWFGDRDVNSNWLHRYMVDRGPAEDLNKLQLYVCCLHWALAQVTPAPLGISPETMQERIFNIIFILLGILLVSQYIAAISRSVSTIRELEEVCAKRITVLTRFTRQHGVSHALASRCVQYLRVHNRTFSKRMDAERKEVLRIFPAALQAELLHEAYAPTLCKHPLFHVIMSADPVALNLLTSEALFVVLVDSGQRLDEPLRGINFVHQGGLSYFEADAQYMCDVVAGNWFCEEVLWARCPGLTGYFVATAAGCEVATILVNTFQNIALKRRVLLRFFANYAHTFVEQFNQESMKCDADCLFNLDVTIGRMVVDVLNMMTVHKIGPASVSVVNGAYAAT